MAEPMTPGSMHETESSGPDDSTIKARQVQEWIKKFTKLMKQTDIIEIICREPITELDERRERNLKALASHYLPELHGESTRKKRKTGCSQSSSGEQGSAVRARKTTKGPFLRLLNLSSLEVHPAVQQFIDAGHAAHPRLFFYSQELDNANDEYGSQQSGEALISQYNYTVALDSQHGLGRARWLFQMLMWHDIVLLTRPDTTGNRVTPTMADDMSAIISNVYGRSEAMQQLPKSKVTAQLRQWSRYGAKAKIFAEKLGAGSLFLLQNELSPYFLNEKTTASGKFYDEAMEHLEKGLQIKKKLRNEPKVQQLAEDIRAYLIRPFEEAQAEWTAKSA